MAAPLDRPGDSSSERPSPETSTRRLREQSQLDFEIEFLGRILERDPYLRRCLRVQANNLAAKGQYGRALQLDRRLVRLDSRKRDRLVQPGLQLRGPGHDRSGVLGSLADESLELGYRTDPPPAPRPRLESPAPRSAFRSSPPPVRIRGELT